MYQLVLKYPQKSVKYSKWPYHTHINIFQSRALQSLPKLGFWVWKKNLAILHLADGLFLLLRFDRWQTRFLIAQWKKWSKMCAGAQCYDLKYIFWQNIAAVLYLRIWLS
jgi:hypothetical protein